MRFSSGSHWVSKFNELKVLAELGFKSELSSLEGIDADIYLYINECYGKEMDAEFNKKLPKGKGKK